jgi:hypothetical protein
MLLCCSSVAFERPNENAITFTFARPQEALFAQIRTGAYEFTSPYWDCVSDDGNVNVNVFSWRARLGSSTVMCTFNESTAICVVCGCLPTRLLTMCAPRRTPPLAAAKDLIARMMELDPARRLSADAVLSHSWMVWRASLCRAPLRVGLHTPRLCRPVTVLSFHGKAPLYGSQSNLSTHAGPLPSGYRTLLPPRANLLLSLPLSPLLHALLLSTLPPLYLTSTSFPYTPLPHVPSPLFVALALALPQGLGATGVHLGVAQEKLRTFNSRRKLKAHMLVARAASKLGRLTAMGSFRRK